MGSTATQGGIRGSARVRRTLPITPSQLYPTARYALAGRHSTAALLAPYRGAVPVQRRGA